MKDTRIWAMIERYYSMGGGVWSWAINAWVAISRITWFNRFWAVPYNNFGLVFKGRSSFLAVQKKEVDDFLHVVANEWVEKRGRGEVRWYDNISTNATTEWRCFYDLNTYFVLNNSRRSFSLSLKQPREVMLESTSGSRSSTEGMMWV